MFLRLYLKHKYPDPVITPPLTSLAARSRFGNISRFISLFSPCAAGRRDDGVRREKLNFGFTVPVRDARWQPKIGYKAYS